MRNIFREILKELPEPQNKVIADDPQDQDVADQMTALINMEVAQSRQDPQVHYPGCQRKWITKEEALEKLPKESEDDRA